MSSSMLSGMAGSQAILRPIVSLLGHRDPMQVASDALIAVIEHSGATCGSILFVSRPTIRVREGRMSDTLRAHVDQWESNLEQRIIAGPWRLAEKERAALATRRVQGTDQSIVFTLILDELSVTGSICLAFRQSQLPTGEERKTLVLLLEAVGRLLSLVGEAAYTKERLSQLILFYQMAQSMASTFELNKLLTDTMQLATAVLDASVSALMLVDEDSQELVYEYAYGLKGSALRKQRTPLDEGIAGWVATHGTPLIVNDVRNDPRFDDQVDARTGLLTQSVVCVPIQIRGKVIGVLEALNKRDGAGFDSEDLNLMTTTANQAAIAIENVRLYQSLRDERDRVIQIQENLRRQVARNLHDGTVQFLAAISMGIDHMERLLDLNPEVARSELEALRGLTRQATQQARLALFELRPLILETQGLVPALEAYVEQLQGSEEFGVHLAAEPRLPELDQSVAVTVFAIVQEAVANVKKHAAARDVWLRLSQEDGHLRVVIEDNGKGFNARAVDRDYDKQRSIGLLTMRERAGLIDGTLTIQSDTSPSRSGTKIILQVPLTPTTANDEP